MLALQIQTPLITIPIAIAIHVVNAAVKYNAMVHAAAQLHQIHLVMELHAIPAAEQYNVMAHAVHYLQLITEQHAALEIAEELIVQAHATLHNHAL